MNVKEKSGHRAPETARTMPARPVQRPAEFTRTIASISGSTPVVESMRSFLGRNDNWQVPTEDAADLFVKRLRGERPQVEARMRRILAFQQAIAGQQTRELRTARFRGSDFDQGLVVFDYVPESRTASDLLAGDELDTDLAHRMGRILGEIHRLPPPAPDRPEVAEANKATTFYALSPQAYADCSGGEVEAWSMLQHDRLLVETLDRLSRRSAQAPATATHGDIRLDQFLLAGDDIYVIDWEEFRLGDPARDVGSFAGEFVRHAVGRMFSELDIDLGLTPGAAHEAILAAGDEHLMNIREHVCRFWDGYQETAEIDEGLAVRATSYLGWHFIDRLLAGAVHAVKLSAIEKGMAGIGRNALLMPERFAAVIGLGEE
ncbi:class V lanthionine synthetase subunit LxmK [Rhizohabitans arisaemae]|uniref:class V lanthionine synthetase subunit LxmK n=1 Tax=Rhizohabitans arisaemae TaxID=2720610 RepID=UPI0024B188FB|nr:class V lanthionine synthetase subunit LxmK [Rhizohabitans arisaemae]